MEAGGLSQKFQAVSRSRSPSGRNPVRSLIFRLGRGEESRLSRPGRAPNGTCGLGQGWEAGPRACLPYPPAPESTGKV